MRTSSTSWLTVAGGVSAAITWLLQVLVGRALGPADYASFMVIWGIVFFAIGSLLGVQQTIMQRAKSNAAKRQDALTTSSSDARPARRVSLLGFGAIVGVLFGGAVVATNWLWLPLALPSAQPSVVAALAVGVFGYTIYHALTGAVAAEQSWFTYASAIVLESVVRFVAVVLAVFLGLNVAGQAWGLVAAAFTWILLMVARTPRSLFTRRSSVQLLSTLRFAIPAMAATTISALLVAGFPALLQMTQSEQLPAQAGVLIAAVTVTRAPLLMALNAYQSVYLTRLIRDQARFPRLLRLSLLWCTLLSAAGSIAAWLVGPFLLRAMYGKGFVLSHSTIAILVLSSGVLCAHTLLGLTLMARGRPNSYFAAWSVALLSTSGLLMTDWASFATTVIVALTIGPILGLSCSLILLMVRPTY